MCRLVLLLFLLIAVSVGQEEQLASKGQRLLKRLRNVQGEIENLDKLQQRALLAKLNQKFSGKQSELEYLMSHSRPYRTEVLRNMVQIPEDLVTFMTNEVTTRRETPVGALWGDVKKKKLPPFGNG